MTSSFSCKLKWKFYVNSYKKNWQQQVRVWGHVNGECVCLSGRMNCDLSGPSYFQGTYRVFIRHLVCRRGIGREMHKNGSKVLLCLRQWGHVKEDLKKYKNTTKNSLPFVPFPCQISAIRYFINICNSLVSFKQL